MRAATKTLARNLIKHSSISLPFALIIEILSAIQIIHISLASSFQTSLTKRAAFSGFFREVTKYSGAVTLFDPPASESTLGIVLIALLIYQILHILLFSGLVFLQTFEKIKLGPRTWKAFSKLYLLHSRLFFFPVQYFFMGILNLYIDCENSASGTFYCKDYAAIVAVLGAILNIAWAFIQEFLFYCVTKTKNPYAVKNNIFHRVVIMHKTVGVLLYFLVQQLDYNDIVHGVFDMCFALLSSYVFFNNLPFYNNLMIRARVVMNGVTLGCSFTLLLVVFGVDEKVMEIPWIMLAFLLTKTSLGILNEITRRVLQGDLKTPEKLIYFFGLLKEHNYGHFSLEVDRLKFPKGGILVNGSLIRQNIETTIIKEGKNSKEYENEIYGLLLDKMHTLYSRHPRCVPLALYMARIYMKRQGNIIQAINLMKKIGSMSFTIPLESAIEEFFVTMKREYTEKYRDTDKNFALLDYFAYRDTADKIKEQIKVETQKHMEFWQEMRKEKGVDCKRIFDLAYSVESLSEKIESSFQQNIFGFSRTLANSLLLYKIYLERLREAPNEARKNMKKFIAIIHNPIVRHALDVYSSEKAVLILSLQKDHVGEILDISGSAQAIFRSDKSKMIGFGLTLTLRTTAKELSTIMPEAFARSHTIFLNNYLKSAKNSIRSKIRTYGKTADGNLFELQGQFQLYPEIEQEVKVMVLFQRLTPPIPVMFIGLDGTILECSETLRKNMNNMNISVGTTKLQNLAFDFNLINTAFNSERVNMVYGPKIDEKYKSSTSKTTATSTFGMRFTKTNHRTMEKNIEESYYTTFTAESEKLDQDKAKQICDGFRSGGKLSFSGYSEVEYDVAIEPYSLEGGFYKVLTIKNQETFVEKLPKNVSIDFERKTTNQTQQIVSGAEFSMFAEDFPIAEEREPITPSAGITQSADIKKILKPGTSVKSDNQSDIGRLLRHLTTTKFGKQDTFDAPFTNQLTIPVAQNEIKSIDLFAKQETGGAGIGFIGGGGSSILQEGGEKAKPNKVLSSSMDPAKTQEVQREMSVASYATSGVYTIKSLTSLGRKRAILILKKETKKQNY